MASAFASLTASLAAKRKGKEVEKKEAGKDAKDTKEVVKVKAHGTEEGDGHPPSSVASPREGAEKETEKKRESARFQGLEFVWL